MNWMKNVFVNFMQLSYFLSKLNKFYFQVFVENNKIKNFLNFSLTVTSVVILLNFLLATKHQPFYSSCLFLKDTWNNRIRMENTCAKRPQHSHTLLHKLFKSHKLNIETYSIYCTCCLIQHNVWNLIHNDEHKEH